MGDLDGRIALVTGASRGIGATTARAQAAQIHPLGHMGQPQNIADAIVFLASDRAAFMTGSELVVDGGLTAS